MFPKVGPILCTRTIHNQRLMNLCSKLTRRITGSFPSRFGFIRAQGSGAAYDHAHKFG